MLTMLPNNSVVAAAGEVADAVVAAEAGVAAVAETGDLPSVREIHLYDAGCAAQKSLLWDPNRNPPDNFGTVNPLTMGRLWAVRAGIPPIHFLLCLSNARLSEIFFMDNYLLM